MYTNKINPAEQVSVTLTSMVQDQDQNVNDVFKMRGQSYIAIAHNLLNFTNSGHITVDIRQGAYQH